MTTARDMWCERTFAARIAEECAAGRNVVLCAVLASRGSTPRAAGARMALCADGTFVGTIGGGSIERIAQDRCRAFVRAGGLGGATEWLTHAKTGVACGGDVLVGVRTIGPDDAGLVQRLLVQEGETLALEEDWSDPAHPTWFLHRLDAGSPVDVSPSWDEDTQRYTSVIEPLPCVYVFGAGHVGSALVPVLASIGLRVVVCDDRAELAKADRLRDAERVEHGSYEALAAAAPISSRDFVVVLTETHAFDIEVLAAVLPKNPFYVGCMGSAKKAAYVRKMLTEQGLSEERIGAIHMPIGVDIGAETPTELAVAIAAQIISERSLMTSGVPR